MATGLVRGYTRHLVSPSPGQGRTDPLDRGLIGEWRFDPVTGLTLPDYSGYGNHGTLNAAGQSWTATDKGPAVTFDGVNDRYISTTCPGVLGSANRTVEVFFKTSHSDEQVLVAWGNDAVSGGKYNFRIDDTIGGDWVLRVEVVDGYMRWDTAVDDGNWHHAVAVLDGTDVTDIVLYLDNVVDTVEASGAEAMNTLLDDPVRIGDALYGTSGRVFQGEIGLVRIYNRALTAGEVQGRYQLCQQRQQRILFGWMLPPAKVPRMSRHPAVVYQTPAIY